MSDEEANKPADKPEILIIDDSKVIRKAAAKMLGEDYIVHEAADGKEGWLQLEQNTAISVVFSDMQMPVMNGMEVLKKIRESDNEQIASLPVIIITGQGDTEETKREVFDAGATDFVAKPFGSIDLISRAKAYAQLNRKVVELEKQSSHDALTGLFNANSLEEQGDKALSFAIRHKLCISSVYLEIDGFQELFLKHGKKVAQQIIIAVANRLGGVLRTEDVAARVGVARYAMLLPLTNTTHAKIVVDRVRESINKLVFDTGKEKLRIVLAAGMTSIEAAEGMKFADLMAQSEVALKRALGKAGDKIASYVEKEKAEEVAKIESPVTDEDLQAAFKHILEGEFFKIETVHVELLKKRLMPFLEYAGNQAKEKLTGTDSLA